ncbi:MAG: DUF1592 domain-containing protein [Acidobacteria bacterium]|nr:DUF1592 domain-containing protein [Acidobacteriota bacterium]
MKYPLIPFALSALAFAQPPAAILRQYCFQCHGAEKPMGSISIERITGEASIADSYQHWEKVAAALEQKRMPPAKMPQPTDGERTAATKWIRTRLNDYARQHAGDPGKVTVRRLTSSEYAYTIQDLTGVEIKFDGDFVADSAGGEGFTNFGDVQFVDNQSLERYLEAAKLVANHAVVGSGPLGFYTHPGKSGFELSAIHRINEIYRAYGFRTASAEGGLPYGLDVYSKAVYACWQFANRAALGQPSAALAGFARKQGVTARFAEHIWSVLQQPNPGYPTSDLVAKFNAIPAKDEKAARAAAAEIQRFLLDWPRFLLGAGALAQGGLGDERALILTEESVQATASHRFRFLYFPRNGAGAGDQNRRPLKSIPVSLSVVTANPAAVDKPVVYWKNATVRFRKADRSAGEQTPLLSVLTPEARAKISLPPAGSTYDFATPAGTSLVVDIAAPPGTFAAEIVAEAELANVEKGDAVVRATISESADLAKGRPASALLGSPNSEGYKKWKEDVLRFAFNLPQASHGEPTPADRDPIPPPFNNTYNQPERDRYHVKVKYYRADGFLVDKMLDDATRANLNRAWNDIYASFEYHDAILDFVKDKYKLEHLRKKGIDQLTMAEIDSLPNEPRKYVEALRAENDAVDKAQKAAQAGHVEDCLRLASKAWRRPLTEAEKTKLRAFYKSAGPDHDKAIRALLVRVLVAPQFLYRVETQSAAKALTNHELASRLSYFLWSSIPDAELDRAATAGELQNPLQLEKQARRMLADPKARRLAVEFFGQWLGFYRFDEYRGADPSRFPEFTAEVKAGMYNEAVSLFEHIVRKDRPVREFYGADYTFLTPALAKHYGVKAEGDGSAPTPNAPAFHRGGVFRLGAVLTATSAPLRTSPVKRGDWVLRRILGTPTPPPPPDAGSIPADEKQFGGQSLKERLQSHQRNATCAGCHTRIDPLGFPFERYDAVGRWRESYSDGKPVEDTATTVDKQTIQGVDGLIQVVKANEPQVLKTLSQKLIGFALGRTASISDKLLIDEMVKPGGDQNFSRLVTQVVASRQFRYRRGPEATQLAQGGRKQ